MNFFKAPALLKYVYPNLLWDKKKESKRKQVRKVYLTFDDGPIPDVTDFVLDTLKEYQIKATFFCVGNNVDLYPHIFKKISGKGHVIGNHTYSHMNGWDSKDQDYFNDITRCQNTLIKHLPEKALPLQHLLRPPHGRIKKSQIQFLKHDYKIVMWDILSGDFDATFNEEKCLEKCIEHTAPGTIIIFHDSYKAEKNIRYVLPRYLDHFASAGFHFDTL